MVSGAIDDICYFCSLSGKFQEFSQFFHKICRYNCKFLEIAACHNHTEDNQRIENARRNGHIVYRQMGALSCSVKIEIVEHNDEIRFSSVS